MANDDKEKENLTTTPTPSKKEQKKLEKVEKKEIKKNKKLEKNKKKIEKKEQKKADKVAKKQKRIEEKGANHKMPIIMLIFFGLIILAGVVYVAIKDYISYTTPPTPIVEVVTMTDDNVITIKYSIPTNKKYKDIYCLFNTTGIKPTAGDDKWILTVNNECSTPLDDNIYYAYLKNQNNEIIEINQTSEFGEITKIEANKEKIYIAKEGTYSLSAEVEKIGNISKNVIWKSADDEIAKVDENGKVTGVSYGTTKIIAQSATRSDEVEVLVTSLITKKPKTFNNNKSYLPCGKYSKADNDLLDEILKDRINDVGYKTRAGAVEAARFLALEFPYKIRYFSENGRETTNGVQGEGRYYNEGLYLHSSRYTNIKKPMKGKATWGCQIWSNPSKGYRANGLDCSGYITWVMLNGGFDVKDVGAGVSAGVLDLTDYGKKTRFTDEVLKSGQIKIGDLLSSEGPAGGHIAMIVGEDDNYYYVTESLWTPPNVSVTIIAYPKTSSIKKKTGSSRAVVNDRYYWVMLMDDYYKEDGKLTTLWY